MTGIDFIDTIVVRTVDKGTRIVKETVKKQNWAGTEFKKFEKERRKLAGNVSLATHKGTKTINLGKLAETQIPSMSGLVLSTGRGTGIRKA